MQGTLNYAGQLVIEECHCGIKHAIPAQLQAQARDHGKTVYCPLGHSWVYTDTTDNKLKREREAREAAERRVTATRELLAHEERSHAATRGHLTRSKRRASAGTCPCCNRTFEQLARHMKSQHPAFVEAAKPTH